MKTTVNKLMSRGLITIASGSSVAEAGLLMEQKRIRHLPVIDSSGLIIGMFSNRDLTQVPDPRTLVVDWLMSTPVTYVSTELPLKKALLKMLELKISSLIIVNSDDLVEGILTTDDLIWFLAQNLSDDEDSSNSKSFKEMTLQTVGQVSQQLANIGI